MPTFKRKLVELSSHVVDHHPPAMVRPEPDHFVDEVRHHLVDGVAVGGDVFWLQHPGIQDAADALPLGPHSEKPGRRKDEDVERRARQRHGSSRIRSRLHNFHTLSLESKSCFDKGEFRQVVEVSPLSFSLIILVTLNYFIHPSMLV